MTKTTPTLAISEEPDVTAAMNDSGEFQSSRVATIAAGHGVHDTYTAFLAPLLPVLIEKFSLTLTQAGALSLFLQAPSLLQPVIGHMADKFTMRYFVILAPAITGSMMSLLGVAPSYLALALFLLIAGMSSAGLHAVGPVMAGRVSGTRLGRGMGYWMVAGELGRTIGPILVVTAIGFLTLEGLPILMVGGWLTSLILYIKLREIPGRDPNAKLGLPVRDALRAMRSFMIPLAGILVSRAFMSASITTYLPTYLHSEGAELWFAGAALSILEAAGVVGVLVGGSISDRVGRRIILLISMIATPLLAVVFLLASGVQQIVVLPFLGFFALSTTPVMMAWVQESYPENRALANGIFMAMAFVIRAVAIVILGRVGDIYGLGLGFLISAAIMAAGIPLVFLLPGKKLNERA